MTRVSRRLFAGLLALLVAMPLSVGQARAAYTQAELDQMLAPIALYPDELLSQILMACTYPLEVIEAARWSRAHPGIEGDAAVRLVQDRDWDPSVKSLVAFPQMLQRMDENLEWTRQLGEAFIVQEPVVMERIQELRRRAQAAGELASDERLRVTEDGQLIEIEPVNPEIVYVPYYDPSVAFGPWWWPAYPPVAWAPWPGYARVYRPGLRVGFWWGAPVAISAGFFFGRVDWRHRDVTVVRVDNYYVRPAITARTSILSAGHWQHDPRHRRGAEYRDAGLRQQFAAPAPRVVAPAPPAAAPVPLRERPREQPRQSFAAPSVTPPSAVAPAPQREQPRQSFAPPSASPPPAVAPAPLRERPREQPRRDEPRFGVQQPQEQRPEARRAERQPELRRQEARPGPASPPAAAPMPPARVERTAPARVQQAPAPRAERAPAPRAPVQREERGSAQHPER